MDQLRADVLLDLLSGSGSAGPGERTGVVDIRVDLATLAHLDDHPGELAGYGPVIADIARRITEEQGSSEWRYTVTDPTGRIVGTGATRRRPTVDQRRRVEALNPTCVFPGCRMPATDCDLDHRRPYSEGGPTDVANLAPLCRHDHRIQRQAGWAHEELAGGTHRWTSRLGHVYETKGAPP